MISFLEWRLIPRKVDLCSAYIWYRFISWLGKVAVMCSWRFTTIAPVFAPFPPTGMALQRGAWSSKNSSHRRPAQANVWHSHSPRPGRAPSPTKEINCKSRILYYLHFTVYPYISSLYSPGAAPNGPPPQSRVGVQLLYPSPWHPVSQWVLLPLAALVSKYRYTFPNHRSYSQYLTSLFNSCLR